MSVEKDTVTNRASENLRNCDAFFILTMKEGEEPKVEIGIDQGTCQDVLDFAKIIHFMADKAEAQALQELNNKS